MLLERSVFILMWSVRCIIERSVHQYGLYFVCVVEECVF